MWRDTSFRCHLSTFTMPLSLCFVKPAADFPPRSVCAHFLRFHIWYDARLLLRVLLVGRKFLVARGPSSSSSSAPVFLGIRNVRRGLGWLYASHFVSGHLFGGRADTKKTSRALSSHRVIGHAAWRHRVGDGARLGEASSVTPLSHYPSSLFSSRLFLPRSALSPGAPLFASVAA